MKIIVFCGNFKQRGSRGVNLYNSYKTYLKVCQKHPDEHESLTLHPLYQANFEQQKTTAKRMSFTVVLEFC